MPYRFLLKIKIRTHGVQKEEAIKMTFYISTVNLCIMPDILAGAEELLVQLGYLLFVQLVLCCKNLTD